MQASAFAHTVDLPVDCATAFGFLTDSARVPGYDTDFRSWVPRDDPLRLGTLVDFEARYGRIWAKGTSRIEAVEPPHRLALTLVRPRTPIGSHLVWEFEPADPGCRFTYRFEVRAPGGLGWAGRRMLALATAGMADKLDALPAAIARA